MPAIPPIDESQLEALCNVLADTSAGLRIGRYLRECAIHDPTPEQTKRVRLFEALRTKQRHDGCANNVFAFLKRVVNPVLYHSMPDYYPAFIGRINKPLAFAGYQVLETGEVVPVKSAKTLTEAEDRADRLQAELRRRNVHADVLKFCRAELVQQNYFHAVLEATKSVSQKIRDKSGLTGDAGELAMKAFSVGQAGMPFLAFNSLQTDTEKSEQSGIMNLFVGMFGAFRNVTAHGPRISWNMTEQDALDLLTFLSLLHRRLDSTARTPRTA
jgi:uncharacterized protein (TIGR02391 family)